MTFRNYTLPLAFSKAQVAAIALTLICTTPTHAQKLYKVVDENGNVSYQDTPPVTETDKVEKKYASRKGMHLRKTAPANEGSNDGLDSLNENGEDIVEDDAPDLVPSESLGVNSPDLQLNADDDGPLPSNIMEVPAHRRNDAIGDFRRTQETIDENGGVVPEKRAKIKVIPQKRKRLSQQELNDIARSANQ